MKGKIFAVLCTGALLTGQLLSQPSPILPPLPVLAMRMG